MKPGLALLIALTVVTTKGMAAAPIRPTDPNFIVAELPGGASRPRDSFAGRLAESRTDARKAEILAGEILEEARRSLQPQLYGRAEKVLAPWVSRSDAPAALLTMEADIQQQRHDFETAARLLDRVIALDPRATRAHLMRANTYIVTGQFARARPDCAWLLASGDSWAGSVCLSQILGSSGQLGSAATLLDRLVSQPSTQVPPEVLSWTLGVRADIAIRSGALADAENLLVRAVGVMPSSDYLRLMLADVLWTERRAQEASEALRSTRPSVGALLRRVEISGINGRNPEGQTALADLRERLAVSAQRGERTHLREEARLALDLTPDSGKTLSLARDNFSVQKETEDVRILARAAAAAHDRSAVAELNEWVHRTGYQDVVVERLLNSERR